jgi:hypothetical protein
MLSEHVKWVHRAGGVDTIFQDMQQQQQQEEEL